MSPFVLLLLLFALGGGKSKPKRAVANIPETDCGDVDAVASAMADHLRGTMKPADVEWYRGQEGWTPTIESQMQSVLATWTVRKLDGTGEPQAFPWQREPDGPYAWTLVRDNPATLPPFCADQIRQAVSKAWAIVALSL